MNTRLIVKNIPKNIDEANLNKLFSKFGSVTDVKIMIKNDINRRFCFIGFTDEKGAKEALQYYNNSYIHASKVKVEYAKAREDIKEQMENKQKMQKEKIHKKHEEKKQQIQQRNNKPDEFKEFLDLMKTGSAKNMSWNDVISTQEKTQKKKELKQQEKENEKYENSLKRIEEQQEKKQKQQEKHNKKEEKLEEKIEIEEENNEKVLDSRRLYVTNIPYEVKYDQVHDLFAKYGKITEFKLPYNREAQKHKGFCFVQFEMPEEALRCTAELDSKVVFGRIMTIKQAYENPVKKDENLEEGQEQKEEQEDTNTSSYKKQKKVEMRKKLEDKTNWNTLFLNPQSILESIAQRYNSNKSDILKAESPEMAVRIAHAETQIIKETKEWMLGQGMNLDFLDSDRQECKRSDTIILVKNIPFQISEEKLKDTFGHFGQIDKVLVSPNKSICIVEFISPDDAKNAFTQLSYHIINHCPLYLEWAPFDMLESEKQEQKQNNEEQQTEENALTKILYVKNLNFKTTDQQLQKHFESYNVGDIKSVRIVKNKNGESSGYGFVEFNSTDAVMNSLKKVQNQKLDNHLLQLSVSRQKKTEEHKVKRKAKKMFEESSKIVVRNLSFEANQKELKELFKAYGEIKSIRLPKKINGQHRGFAFVEFISVEEAKNAVESLGNTHLYGRKMVLEYAKQEFDD